MYTEIIIGITVKLSYTDIIKSVEQLAERRFFFVCVQVGSMLINRVTNTDHSWHKEWIAPRVSPHFDLTLDDKSVLRAIEQLNFIQMKRKSGDRNLDIHIFKCGLA